MAILRVRQEPITIPAAHAQRSPIFKKHFEVSVPEWFDLFNLFNANNRRTADPGESPGVELSFEIANRHSQQVRPSAGVNFGIICRGSNPVHVIRLE